MSSYVMTPLKELPITMASTSSLKGIKRKVEFDTPMKEIPVNVADAASPRVKRKMEFDFSPVDLRRRIKHRRKDPLQMPENLEPKVISGRCSTIKSAIKYRYDNIVLAWCPNSVVTGDFLSTLVYKYGKVSCLRDRWLPAASRDGKMEWAGMTVSYEEEGDAIKAANGLPLQSKYVKTILMKEVINHIAQIEAGYPRYGKGHTNVFIIFDYAIEAEDRLRLENLLQHFGYVLGTRYKENVCKVQYRYFTHAHLACVVLDENKLENLGKITAKIGNSKKKDYILDLLKENVMLHLEECCFTR